MKNFVPTDNTLSQTLGTRLKQWLKTYTTKLAAVDPNTNLEKEVSVLELATLDNVDAVVQVEVDALEQAIADEAETRAAADIQERTLREAAIQALNEVLGSLQGIVTYLDSYNFGISTPSQDALTSYALTKTGWSEVHNSTTVRNEFDQCEWIYNSETVRWINFGQTSVVQASELLAGIVKSSSSVGKVTVLSDGTMQPNGFATLDSPALTGTPTAPTPATSDSSSKIATTEAVDAKIAAQGGGSSGSYAPLPQTASGVGQFGKLFNSSISGTTKSYTLPAGGTWAYFFWWTSTSSPYGLGTVPITGIAAGNAQVTSHGTTITTQAVGFCWRIT